MYKLEYNTMDGKVGSIRRLYDNASIPLAEDNADYQEFKKWNAEQATKLNLESVNQDIIAVNLALKAKQAKKKQDIETNLATWKELSDSLNAASNVKELRDVVLRLARVVYWLGKDEEL